MEVGGSEKSIRTKIMGDIHLDKYCESDNKKNVMLDNMQIRNQII